MLATGGIGKSFKVTSQLLGVHRRRARAGDEGRRDAAQHGVRPVPPDRHGLAAQRQGHPRHRVGARRRRRPEELRGQAVHVRLRPRRLPQAVRGDRGGGRRAGTTTRPTTAARPSCCPATRSPARSTPRSRPAAGHPHGGVFLDIASRLPAEAIRKKLPSMYHQFKELADVDITAEPMEVGPTCHYVMGGVEVDPDTAAAVVPGLFAAGEVAGGMHGSNRLGGNSLSDLLVFGRRAGAGAATYVDALGAARPAVARRRRRGRAGGREAPFDGDGRREPLRDPRRPAADDERPGRHHPQPRGDGAGARQPRGAQGRAAKTISVAGRQGLQPRLAPRPRPATTCSSSPSASPGRR